MARPRLLDLFCCAGGAAVGYDRAGFDVVGVDIVDRPRYPFEFHRADALEFPLGGFDAIHASPPCQFASRARLVGTRKANAPLNLIPATRERLIASGVPYVIENVEHAKAHLRGPLLLCGSMFGLGLDRGGERFQLRRHRLFESSVMLMAPGPCAHRGRVLGVYHTMGDQVQGTSSATGKYVLGGRTVDTVEEARAIMGIDWMGWAEIKEAIPPAYTEHVGRALLAVI